MEYIATNLLAAIDHLAGLLRKKTIPYDIAALRSDVVKVLSAWRSSTPAQTPAKSPRKTTRSSHRPD
jgi:hypothetical protein